MRALDFLILALMFVIYMVVDAALPLFFAVMFLSLAIGRFLRGEKL